MRQILESQSEVLHQDQDAKVTPSWLTVGGTSYAIRTVVRLNYREYKPPTVAASIVFFFSLILICLCLLYLFRDTLPTLIAWTLLIASTSLMLWAAWYAFAENPHYEVQITLLDGNRILAKRARRSDAEGLHQGLTDAMDWHYGGEILLGADRHNQQNSPEPTIKRQVDALSGDNAAIDPVQRSRTQHNIAFLSALFRGKTG